LTGRSVKKVAMSPRTARQYDTIRKAKRALIKEVALTCFADLGFHSTTISTIAAKAGISKGLIYNYFRSKDDILAEIVSESIDELYSSFDTDHDGHLSVEEFEVFVRKIFDIIREKSRFWRLLFAIMMQNDVYERLFVRENDLVKRGGENMRVFSQEMVRMFIEYFTARGNGSDESYDPMIEMLMFVNTLKGFALTFLFSEELYSTPYYEKMVDAIISRYR